ncbi:MAG TPA: Ig-like domain-containing protein, partial [Blastocatellia bacterium]|nr:Ig-like domain-containing protein [Blastocatellia bacterium]
MKLRTSFRVITIFSVTVLLLGTIGFISIQARKANLKNSISSRPITVQPAASRQTIKKAHAFGQKEAEETSSFNLYKYSFGFEPMFFVPTITATKTASLATDVNGNGFVNPGDTLMYSVVVSNSGTDAMNVVFSDQLNANLTQSGSATASPIATNDAYTSIGNVGITVPAGSGLLINDINPQGTGTISIMAVPAGTTTQGGSYALAADGSFSYNPPVGFEGADSFVYTLTHTNGKMDTGTVNLTVSGMIWFINNNAAACTTIAGGCGRLSSPFSTLAAFSAVNIGGGSNPATNDNIFIYESGTQYTGAVTLLTGQKLIGQDATATLATITGISVPTFSNALPAMNSGNGTITNIGSTVTLNTNTTLRGFSINSGSSTGVNDPAGAITGVSVSEVNVTTTTGTGVLLSSTGGTLSFIKVASNGAANGISLTSTTGSFAVTGTGSAGTGGTIQNSTGNGVTLSTAASVSLSWMNIQNSGDDGINGSTVTGFSFSDGSVINNGNSTSDEGFDFTDLFGTCSITNATVTGNAHNNFKLLN